MEISHPLFVYLDALSFSSFPESAVKRMNELGIDSRSVDRLISVDIDLPANINAVSFDYLLDSFFTQTLTVTGILPSGVEFQKTGRIDGALVRWVETDVVAPPGGFLTHIRVEGNHNGFTGFGIDTINYSKVPDAGSTLPMLAISFLGVATFRRRYGRKT